EWRSQRRWRPASRAAARGAEGAAPAHRGSSPTALARSARPPAARAGPATREPARDPQASSPGGAGPAPDAAGRADSTGGVRVALRPAGSRASVEERRPQDGGPEERVEERARTERPPQGRPGADVAEIPRSPD